MFWLSRKRFSGVVGGLDARQPRVVGAVAGAHGGVAVLEQTREVEVGLAVGEPRRGLPERLRISRGGAGTSRPWFRSRRRRNRPGTAPSGSDTGAGKNGSSERWKAR